MCICWYQGQGHLQRSRSNIKVTFLKKWPFRGHSCFTNTSCSNLKILIKTMKIILEMIICKCYCMVGQCVASTKMSFKWSEVALSFVYFCLLLKCIFLVAANTWVNHRTTDCHLHNVFHSFNQYA